VLGPPREPLVEDQVVVEPLGVQELLVRSAEILADRLRRTEVEGGARDVGELAGGDEVRVDRCEAGRGDGQFVVVDRAAALARQVPVHVVGEVDDRGPVGGGLVVDAPVAVPGERVRDLRRQRAGVAHLAVGAGAAQDQAHVGAGGELLHGPYVLVEAVGPAVQVVPAVVDGELVVLAVEGEPAAGDAVAVPADDGAEVRAGRLVLLDRPETERHVRVPAVAVREFE
jgi:hypothetical protein